MKTDENGREGRNVRNVRNGVRDRQRMIILSKISTKMLYPKFGSDEYMTPTVARYNNNIMGENISNNL